MRNKGQAGDRSEALSALFAAYRDAIPDPEPSANFTPGIWEKIEARRTFAFTLRRFAQGIVTAAAAVSLLLSVFLAAHTAPFTASYLETLAADQEHESIADTEIVQVDHDHDAYEHYR